MKTINYDSQDNPNIPIAQLAKAVTTDALAAGIAHALKGSGGAGVALTVMITLPGMVADVGITVSHQKGTGYSAVLDGSTEIITGTAIAGVISSAIAAGAVGLGATVGLPLTIATVAGTGIWMYANNDSVENFTDMMKSIVHRVYDGQPNKEWLDFASRVLEGLDGWLGTPDNTNPFTKWLLDLRDYFGINTPIALDLNGDGIKYTSIERSNAYFDLDNDGFVERAEWINKKDGFLVRDLNKNGAIDNQTEMFGDNGGTSAYEKLAKLDTNGDHKVDKHDKGFASLKIWRDLNGNGETDKGELKTLAQTGIKSLSLQKTEATMLDGHRVQGTSVFTWSDGTKGKAADVLLELDQMDSWYVKNDIDVDPETAFLPLSRGYGDLKSFHLAMSENAALKSLMKDFTALDVKTQMHLVYDKVQALLLEWGGAGNLAPGIEGDDAKKALLQALTGTEGTNNVDMPFGLFMGVMLERLLVQGPLGHVFTQAYYDFAKDDIVLREPLTDILSNAKAGEPAGRGDKTVYWNEITRILLSHNEEFKLTDAQVQAKVDAAAGFHTWVATAQGTSKNDHIHTNIQDDVIFGNGGDDYIYGNLGNDTINGGSGDDTLDGMFGDDTYLIHFGSGVDTVLGSVGADTLRFAEGITFASLKLQSLNGLTVTLSDGSQVRMPDVDVERFVFADGTAKSLSQITQASIAQATTAGNDTIHGFWVDDTINGGAGNDYIDSGNGNDLLFGGAGNDTIDSGWYDDTLDGGAGADRLIGSWGGKDVFVYHAVSESTGAMADTILDFGQGDDHIDLRGLGITGVAAGAANGSTLGYAYDGGTDMTTLSSANGLKILIQGHISLGANDFYFG